MRLVTVVGLGLLGGWCGQLRSVLSWYLKRSFRYSADDEVELTDELIATCTLLMTLCDAGHEMDDHFSWR